MSSTDSKPHRIVKKSASKKNSRTLELGTVAAITDTTFTSSDNDEAGKKAQGIVIDGRTYTCATCKAGHRVGVCKHARERPMKATHPPGRPPAGAPKKVTCDCPKNCNCIKKDCKCARKCHCTQAMYMLVYVSAPGEEENTDEEKGTWKLGEQVMTDLKGNILTAEQVLERQLLKEAMKSFDPSAHGGKRGSSMSSRIEFQSASPATHIKSESGSCCRHKEVVKSREIAAQVLRPTEPRAASSTMGCNCGSTCICAFCPQHPNNETSEKIAKEQAVMLSRQPHGHSPSIVPFSPSMPQDASCMGGQPQFAISRARAMPTYDEMLRTFPNNRGYIIGYPMYSRESPGLPVPSFTVAGGQIPTETLVMPPTVNTNLVGNNVHTSPVPQLEHGHPYDYSTDDFDIGNAFVASAGADGWEHQLMSPLQWPMDHTTQPAPFDSLLPRTDYLSHGTSIATISDPQMPGLSSGHTFEFSSVCNPATSAAAVQLHEPIMMLDPQPSQFQYPSLTMPHLSCCDTSTVHTPFVEAAASSAYDTAPMGSSSGSNVPLNFRSVI